MYHLLWILIVFVACLLLFFTLYVAMEIFLHLACEDIDKEHQEKIEQAKRRLEILKMTGSIEIMDRIEPR